VERPIKALHKSLLDHLTYSFAKDKYSATKRDKFNTVVLSVRENLVEQWMKTQQQYYYKDIKRIYYLSLEFLLGRLLRNYIINLDLSDTYSKAVDVLGVRYEEILEHEWDFGLGNGGLGRLAACFLDSMATLQYPGYGYGIRYEYGIFSQKVKNGYQLESPDNWLRYGNPWEFPRPELIYPVRFYGRVNTITGENGRFRMEWINTDNVMAMAYDYPVPGFHNNTVNTLRLWSAKSSREFHLEYFYSGDYIKAVEDKNNSETISKVLYPDDHTLAGKELRLKQQYFFVSATIRDIIRRYRKYHPTYNEFPEKVAIQLNDTHPAIAIAELMRILVDEAGVAWDDARDITKKTFAYTNHTVLPEALETWSEVLMGHLLPRHLQIIQEIDRRFLIQVAERFPTEPERKWQMAIITGDGEKKVHMARLALVGGHTVNSVSALHGEILRNNVFKNFYQMFPEKFKNVTNGITQRRWLLEANPALSSLISGAIGENWTTDLEELGKLEPLAEDSRFRKRFREVKKANKVALSEFVKRTYNLSFPPSFLLDCQIKRFHEYKRQLLNILHVITLYNKIKDGKTDETFIPRTILFAGKAAPGYFLCKLMIKLIHCVSDAIDAHPVVKEKLKVIFVPDYGVTLAQHIIPAAELSEQISTAGYEASGTGNMKFILNGALTIGTLDGSNVEIREKVGKENFFQFGLNAQEIIELQPNYRPHKYYEEDENLRQIINQLSEGYFSPMEPELFYPIVKSLLEGDRFFVLADYASYINCQENVADVYRDEDRWTKKAIFNVARSGIFSSDRAIREYAEKIWNIFSVAVA
jgi:starch phosphorylase